MEQEINFDKNAKYWYQKGIEDFKNIVTQFSESSQEKMFLNKLEVMSREMLMQTFDVRKALSLMMLKIRTETKSSLATPPTKKKWYQKIFKKL